MPRRRTTQPIPQPKAADEDYVNDHAMQSARRGPKLTPTQVATLKEVIAAYWDCRTIQAVLAEEHTDLDALVGEDTIRYYKRQMDQKTDQALTHAEERVLTSGLARRAVRVGHLQRLYYRCERAVDKVSQLKDIDGNPVFKKDGQPLLEIEFRADVAREMRACLEQIAREVGQPLQSVAQITVNQTTNNTLVVPEARQLIDDVAQLLEAQAAYDRAGEGLVPYEG